MMTARENMAKTSKAIEIVEREAQGVAQRFIEEFLSIQSRCESPIEEILLAAMYAKSSNDCVKLWFCDGEPEDPAAFDEFAFVYQQASINRFRVDILIHDCTLPFDHTHPKWIVVECDGHDFHERTKEQARRDRQRDRFMQSLGYRVLRFTGSEIFGDPERCADEIFDQMAVNEDIRSARR